MSEELMMCGSYEVPVGISDRAKEIVMALDNAGVVLFEHDDGPDLIVRDELKKVFEAIGVDVVEQTPHRVFYISDGAVIRSE